MAPVILVGVLSLTVLRGLRAAIAGGGIVAGAGDLWIPARGFGVASAGPMQSDQSCWLDLLPQELRRSLVTGLGSARASFTPRLAEESTAPSLPSQLHGAG